MSGVCLYIFLAYDVYRLYAHPPARDLEVIRRIDWAGYRKARRYQVSPGAPLFIGDAADIRHRHLVVYPPYGAHWPTLLIFRTNITSSCIADKARWNSTYLLNGV